MHVPGNALIGVNIKRIHGIKLTIQLCPALKVSDGMLQAIYQSMFEML